MPLPTPREDESEDNFITRCMSNDAVKREFPEQEQRLAVCFKQYRTNKMLKDIEETAENYLEKGWLPSGMSQNDLSDGDFAWLSDAYRRGEGSKSSGRKLPYKIHGKVNERGWRAAMAAASGARGGTSFSGGPSKEQVIRRLCRSKPKTIESEVCENLNKEATPYDDIQESGERLVARIQEDMDKQRCFAQIDAFRELVQNAKIIDLTLMQKLRKKLEELIHS